MTTTTTTISLSTIRNHDCGMPIVEVINSETKKVLGYLSPFRKYCFQVSGTFDGQGDLGSSQVIGLQKIAEFTSDVKESSNLGIEGIRKELLLGQAMIALNQFARRHKAVLNTYTKSTVKEPPCYGYTVLDEFIDQVYDYLTVKPVKKTMSHAEVFAQMREEMAAAAR